jgi:hypothetical protein
MPKIHAAIAGLACENGICLFSLQKLYARYPENSGNFVCLPPRETPVNGNHFGDQIMFDIIREFAYGLKLGARHSIDVRHNLTERTMRPSVSAALKNNSVGTDHAGR